MKLESILHKLKVFHSTKEKSENGGKNGKKKSPNLIYDFENIDWRERDGGIRRSPAVEKWLDCAGGMLCSRTTCLVVDEREE